MFSRSLPFRPTLFVVSVLLLSLTCVSQAADEPAPEPPTSELATRQGQLAAKYQQLEMLMLKMAEFDADSNPRRSALLKQALSQSKDRHVRLQLETLVELLQTQQLRRAVDNQTVVGEDLDAILELLLSENREDRLKSEQSRVKEYIKEVERIIRQQRGIQGQTEGGGDPLKLADNQRDVADRTRELKDQIDENEGRPAEPSEGQPSDAESGEGQPSEGQPSEGQPSEGQPGEGQPSDSQSESPSQQDGDSEDQTESEEPAENGGESQDESTDQPGDDGADDPAADKPDPADRDASESSSDGESDPSESPSDGSSGEPSESGQSTPSDSSPSSPQSTPPSPSSPGQGSPGQPGESSPPPPQDAPQYPGRQRIAEAEQRMRDAEQRLEEAKREDAIEAQEEARRLLEEAKAELEEILRQLREEEIERTLAMLESRFRKMLEMQLKVHEDTQTLQKIPDDKRTAQVDIQAGKLSLEERRIVVEADKAILLLQEEGSSVAFPEAVDQMRADMEEVADRLGAVKIDATTVAIEEDIIAALEEMIEAIQKAQQDAEQRQQQPPPPSPQGMPQDQPLVDAIAELKMIRALQMRVNVRTQKYSRMLDDPESPAGQATNEELVESLSRLSEREERIRQITRDIVLGKNR